MTKRMSWVGLALVVAMAGCGSAEERDESRGGFYDGCEESEECPSIAEGCWGIAVDYVDYRTEERGLCSSECVDDAECPADPPGLGGACLALPGGAPALCYERCTSDAECPPEYGCTDRLPAADGGESFFEPICLPIR